MLSDVQRIDPITFEVVRNKLAAITEEQAITLKAVSGSPVVTDATDFNNGLYLADGSIVTMGPQVVCHAGTMPLIIRSIIESFKDGAGIYEGDMFLLNDPYRGAIHQPDMAIVAPVFHEGRHIAWAGSCAHQLDVGGMSFGSWAIGATEVQQEAMLIPGLKLVERGTLRDDLWRMILGMSRLPNMIGLDLKAMIASNNVAITRLKDLMKRYGASTVEAIMKEEIDSSERQMRAVISELPDGVYRARDYIEHDGHTNTLYEVCVTAIKKGDTLTFDMTGTSPQAPGFINCTASGTRGSVIAAIGPILAPHIRWNEGIMRPIEIVMPEGILCNSSWPAPISAATISTAWIVQNAVISATARMVALSEKYACEGPANTKGHMTVLTLAGKDRDGEPYGTFLLDSTAGGGGAYPDHDGLDGSGDYAVPRPAIANVEANESSGPFIYLYRAIVPDSGGPGTMRGGCGTSIAIAPYQTSELEAMMLGHGIEVPNASGQLGGLPGSCGHNFVRFDIGSTGEIAQLAGNLDEILTAGVKELGAKPGRIRLTPRDVIGYSFQGGGGYGDPLKRDPDAVLEDVRNGFVTVAAAQASYGVVIHDYQIDLTATERERSGLRHARLGDHAPARKAVDGGLRLDRDRFICSCGCDLGMISHSWKAHARVNKIAANDYGAHTKLHDELEIREYVCTDCGSLLETEVARKNEGHLVSIQLDIDSRE